MLESILSFFHHTFSSEVVSFFQLLVCWGFLFYLTKKYSSTGVHVYIILMVIVSNIQVLKLAYFSWDNSPIALGTVTFTSTFLATDILTEYFGAAEAKKSIFLGFISFLLFTILMLLHLGIPPLPAGDALKFHDSHNAMMQLFLPMPSIFIAGIAAYFSSQFVDIYIYNGLKKLMDQKMLWVRSFFAAAIAGLIDLTVFSVIAWKILPPHPVDWHTILHTYVLGSLWPRLFVSFSGIPILYWIKRHAKSHCTPIDN